MQTGGLTRRVTCGSCHLWMLYSWRWTKIIGNLFPVTLTRLKVVMPMTTWWLPSTIHSWRQFSCTWISYLNLNLLIIPKIVQNELMRQQHIIMMPHYHLASFPTLTTHWEIITQNRINERLLPKRRRQLQLQGKQGRQKYMHKSRAYRVNSRQSRLEKMIQAHLKAEKEALQSWVSPLCISGSTVIMTPSLLDYNVTMTLSSDTNQMPTGMTASQESYPLQLSLSSNWQPIMDYHAPSTELALAIHTGSWMAPLLHPVKGFPDLLMSDIYSTSTSDSDIYPSFPHQYY